jgi:hypothetical protein
MTKILSFLVLSCLTFNLNVYAANSNITHQSYLPGIGTLLTEDNDQLIFNLENEFTEISNIQGKWTMANRRCLSGAPVLDRYIPGRDLVEITFEERNYQSHSRINGCDYWSTGKYKNNESMIFYSNIRGASNCGPVNVRSRDQNAYQMINEKILKFFSGPFVLGPAPCPIGDTLEFTYIK